MEITEMSSKNSIFWQTLNLSLVIFVTEKENKRYVKHPDIGKSNTESDFDLINNSYR